MRGSFWGGVLLTALAWLGGGCRERVAQRVPPKLDARVAPRTSRVPSLAPRFRPPTVAERAYDAGHRVALRARVAELEASLRALARLARRGAGDPGFRGRWPAARDGYLKKVGQLRARVLAIDPLGTRSWAVRVASHLVSTLEVRLPDAVRESWDPRPSGALSTARADFTLIWQSLRRYVMSLDKEKTKGNSP